MVFSGLVRNQYTVYRYTTLEDIFTTFPVALDETSALATIEINYDWITPLVDDINVTFTAKNRFNNTHTVTINILIFGKIGSLLIFHYCVAIRIVMNSLLRSSSCFFHVYFSMYELVTGS